MYRDIECRNNLPPLEEYLQVIPQRGAGTPDVVSLLPYLNPQAYQPYLPRLNDRSKHTHP